MAPCKLVLFLALASAAIASPVCYFCLPGTEGCDKPQTHESPTVNCTGSLGDMACMKIAVTYEGIPLTVRSCMDPTVISCDDIKKIVDPVEAAELTECKFCKDDLCNGN
ncbi:unnamed protein product [Callosobruchus maculatus]|uniref:Uncharacterized protein n=1 Tax=Callosobruchus maculatus TaxID=64391 RepID=A0A653BKG3_CALMS|nr:unnamed protein product [Callosobruchus maculatus]